MDILDVTLREGQQRAHSSFSVEQKVEVVRSLSEVGVEYIQIGFPVTDDGTAAVCDRLDVQADLTGIARVVDRDIDAAIDAGVDVIELFAPTSDRQLKHVLHGDRDDLIDRIDRAIDLVEHAGVEAHFAAMDGFRTDPPFIGSLIEQFGDAFTYWSIADTVGALVPTEVNRFIDALPETTPVDTIGVHFHDDLGVATANALTAAEMGIGKVDVSVGGIGERTGNTPLEEFVVSASIANLGVDLAVDRSQLVPVALHVLETLDESVPPDKPILGERAFEHESGLHTAAMLDDPATFEPFNPARFGANRTLKFGPQTGRGSAARLLELAGRSPEPERVDALLERLNREGPMSLERALELVDESIAP